MGSATPETGLAYCRLTMSLTFTVGVAPCLFLYQPTIQHDINAYLEAITTNAYYKELHLRVLRTDLPLFEQPFTLIKHGEMGTTTYFGVKIIVRRSGTYGTENLRVRAQSEDFISLAEQRLRKLTLLL